MLRRPFACAAFAVTASVALPLAAAMSAQPFAAAMSAGRPSLPFREDLRYFTLPWKHNENSAERFVRAAAEVLPPDAFVYADITAYAPLACARRCGIISEGVALYGDVWGKCGGSSCWEVRPFPPYRLSPREATLEKRGVIYKVVMP